MTDYQKSKGQGLRSVIRHLTPYNWEIVLRKYKVYDRFLDIVYDNSCKISGKLIKDQSLRYERIRRGFANAKMMNDIRLLIPSNTRCNMYPINWDSLQDDIRQKEEESK
jgi:hypothetical protein